jgi:hypothetical protein
VRPNGAFARTSLVVAFTIFTPPIAIWGTTVPFVAAEADTARAQIRSTVRESTAYSLRLIGPLRPSSTLALDGVGQKGPVDHGCAYSSRVSPHRFGQTS